MSMRSLVLLAVVLAVAPMAALADRSPQYFAIHLGSYEFDPGDDGAEGNGEVVRLKYGYEFSKFLAVEAHFGTDIEGGADPDLRDATLFGRFNLPYERLDVYGLAGVAHLGGDFGDGRESNSGPAIGVGIDFYGTEHSAITLELLRYQVDDDDADDDSVYKTVTLGWTHHFEFPPFRP